MFCLAARAVAGAQPDTVSAGTFQAKSFPGVVYPELGLDDGSVDYRTRIERAIRPWASTLPAHIRTEAINELCERCLAGPEASFEFERIALQLQPIAQNHQRFALSDLACLCVPTPPGTATALAAFYGEFVGASKERQFELLGTQLGSGSGAFSDNCRTALQFLLARFLPPSISLVADRPSARQIGFLSIDPFLAVASTEQKLGVINALLFALRRAADLDHALSPDTQFGYRLGYFLSYLGSGAQKFGQYGHSLPITPEEWLEGLASLKTDEGHRYRWDVWRQVRRMPDKLQSGILSLGARRGSGAYQTAYNVELTSECRRELLAQQTEPRLQRAALALKFTKPGAAQEALGTIDLFLALCGDLINRDARAEGSVEPIRKLLRHARQMIAVETDPQNSVRQVENAARAYRKIRISVDGRVQEVHPQMVLAVGEEFQLVERMQGQQLNRLVKFRDPHARRYAATNLLAQLATKSSGEASDSDAHGDNVAGHQQSVEHIDTGSYELERPPAEQIKLMVHVLLNAALNARRNRYPILSSLKHTMRAMEQGGLRGGAVSEEAFNFISSTQRFILSLLDSWRALAPGDRRQVIRAFVGSGVLNGEIVGTLFQRLTGLGLCYLEDSFGLLSRTPQAVQRQAVMQRLLDLHKDEGFHRKHYYPDNPNPTVKTKRGEAPPKKGAVVVSEPEKEPLDIELSLVDQGFGVRTLLWKGVGEVVYRLLPKSL